MNNHHCFSALKIMKIPFLNPIFLQIYGIIMLAFLEARNAEIKTNNKAGYNNDTAFPKT